MWRPQRWRRRRRHPPESARKHKHLRNAPTPNSQEPSPQQLQWRPEPRSSSLVTSAPSSRAPSRSSAPGSQPRAPFDAIATGAPRVPWASPLRPRRAPPALPAISRAPGRLFRSFLPRWAGSLLTFPHLVPFPCVRLAAPFLAGPRLHFSARALTPSPPISLLGFFSPAPHLSAPLSPHSAWLLSPRAPTPESPFPASQSPLPATSGESAPSTPRATSSAARTHAE